MRDYTQPRRRTRRTRTSNAELQPEEDKKPAKLTTAEAIVALLDNPDLVFAMPSVIGGGILLKSWRGQIVCESKDGNVRSDLFQFTFIDNKKVWEKQN